MKLSLQKGIDPSTGEVIWLVLDEHYQVVVPIQKYLSFLSACRSPNTVEAYGYDLKAWWEFLSHKSLEWRNIQLSDLGDFAYWLRVGDTYKVVSIQPIKALRSERSINRALTAINMFYQYHVGCGSVEPEKFESFSVLRKLNKNHFLSGIAKNKPVKQKLVKLREPKNFPGCLSEQQIEALVNACTRLRDKLIILTLSGTGLRKGELLGLCHEDIGDFEDKSIRVLKRLNPNGARVKGRERIIPISAELMQMYNDYLIYEYPEVESNYVFVNIWEGKIGAPLNPRVLNVMFARLSQKTGIQVHPHLFRHTYATRLLKAGYPIDRVKYLLGHSSIQTTLDIYSHLSVEADLMEVVNREEEG